MTVAAGVKMGGHMAWNVSDLWELRAVQLTAREETWLSNLLPSEPNPASTLDEFGRAPDRPDEDAAQPTSRFQNSNL